MPAFSHTQHTRSHTNTEQQNRLPLGLRRSQRMRSHWPSPHGIHQASGLVPGQPGPGPTFLALETKSSLELQADHGEGLRARGHCSPGEQGGWRVQLEAAPLFLPHITPRGLPLGLCHPPLTAPQSGSSLFQSGSSRLANFLFPFPKSLPTFWTLHMLFYCLECQRIQRCT